MYEGYICGVLEYDLYVLEYILVHLQGERYALCMAGTLLFHVT